MAVYLHGIRTAVPDAAYDQEFIGAELRRSLHADRKTERLISRIYSHSGIAKRHSVIREFHPARTGQIGGAFRDPDTGELRTPGTAARNTLYTEAAKKLAPCLARDVIEACPGITPDQITHVVTVSCTGFFQPGPDYYIVRELGLSARTQRFHVGFMGCYAVFPALKMAEAFCRADPNAVVLVQCLELCSLHLQFTDNLDDILAGSVFADGASATIVSSRPLAPGAAGWRLDHFDSALVPEGEEDMAWTIGDHGFMMRLSTYVPALLQENIAAAVDPLLAAAGIARSDIKHWAVHPGGRAILDKVQSGLELSDEHLSASRVVLRDYGNMSSATTLFVLNQILRENLVPVGGKTLALAFGPGLTVESALLTRVNG